MFESQSVCPSKWPRLIGLYFHYFLAIFKLEIVTTACSSLSVLVLLLFFVSVLRRTVLPHFQKWYNQTVFFFPFHNLTGVLSVSLYLLTISPDTEPRVAWFESLSYLSYVLVMYSWISVLFCQASLCFQSCVKAFKLGDTYTLGFDGKGGPLGEHAWVLVCKKTKQKVIQEHRGGGILLLVFLHYTANDEWEAESGAFIGWWN